MLPSATERVWASRLRWRMRGAWLWPAFALGTVVGGVLIHLLPLAGLRTDLVPALLIAGFANLVVVAAGAPLLGRLVRRRRGDLPRAIAADYAGTGLLCLVAVVFAVVGLVHHSWVAAEQRASARAVLVTRAWAARLAPPSVRGNVARADVIRVDPGRLYRACIPDDATAPDRPLCVLVEVDRTPPRVVPSGREPNASWGGRPY